MAEKIEINWPEKKTEIHRLSLPFQTVEILTENRILEHARLDKWIKGMDWPKNYPKDWKNRLIWGDNKYVMSSLISQGFAGKVDLIYIDPPFATGADFSISIGIGDGNDETIKEASVIEQIAYRDTWGKGLSSYLQMMYERIVLMKELLSDTGSIYVHTDYRVDSYIRLILDEIFGRENLLNEIIWYYQTGGASRKHYARKHDTIFFYSKTENYKFYPERIKIPRTEKSLKRARNPKGARISLDDTTKLPDDVFLIQALNPMAIERCGYPTQKPEELLEVIIKSSSDEGDIIADFFCGSGTTGVVAEKLGRRWILTDLSKYAIHITRKRLLDLHNYHSNYSIPCRPFIIQTLGNYQHHKFLENKHPPVEEYRKFILELYEATPIDGFTFLHGKKGDRFVYVANVDSRVARMELEGCANECVNSSRGNALDVLGWDFEPKINNFVKNLKKLYGIDMALKYIPRIAEEITKITAINKEIRFFNLNSVEIEPTVEGKTVQIKLKNFTFANPEFITDEIRKKITHFTDYIDYWAVDFDYKNNIFHNMWQSFRKRRSRSLIKKVKHTYKTGGRKKILVKIIDIFGNESSALVEVEIKS